jgi:uncharacterized protein YjbI with pentapeptide repeats
MLKRRAAWPQGIRWLAGIAAVMLAAAIVWALFVPLADWLAHHDVGSATGALHETALDNARGRLLTLGAGLVAGGALVFTALNFNLLRRNSEQTDQWQRRTHELTEQGQITDRYTKAVEQLGSDKLDVRIGGIYALERITRDSPKDHPTVMEVLTAFIRDHSREPLPPPDRDHSREPSPPPDTGNPEQRRPRPRRYEDPTTLIRPDVQAAVTVIGRRDATRDILPIDLPGAYLNRAVLTRAYLARAVLTRADLTGARLDGALLAEADLGNADLTRANLTRAQLTGADLGGAKLPRANLTRANLSNADLTDANLSRAFLGGADLGGADLTRADLTDAVLGGPDNTGAMHGAADITEANLFLANLTGADLTGVDLGGAADLSDAKFAGVYLADANLTDADLTGADLTDARWPEGAQVPDGWMVASGSPRRLQRTGE